VTHLGYYPTEEEAARVYDRVAVGLHGEAAHTNYPFEQVRFALALCGLWSLPIHDVGGCCVCRTSSIF
jgi:hypothetical protein